MSSGLSAACEAVTQDPSEKNLESLLDCWSPQWKHRGRQRGIGSGSCDIYCTLGLYAFGGNAPCMSKASAMKEACVAINHFLQDRFPNGKWTSLAVILNPHIGLHRDMRFETRSGQIEEEGLTVRGHATTERCFETLDIERDSGKTAGKYT